MDKLQKIIIASLLLTSSLSWLLSTMQPDMMNVMMTYNPILISLFTASWTAGMAAMMFPAIVPMVLFYSKLIMNKQTGSSTVITERKKNNNHTFKVVLFVGIYLVIWALTGLCLLFSWSIPMNSFVRLLGNNSNQLGIIFGSILIISGIYQFSPLKNKCIGYCESPLSFFMKRWNNGKIGAVKMGAYHGLYCLGCCWPYFLIMMALGWMNLMWMGLFTLIIFGEKMWSKGIWIARAVGISLIITGISSTLGIITLYNAAMVMNIQNNGGDKMIMSQDKKTTTAPNYINQSKAEVSNGIMLQSKMNM
jgi:predicted metal-binding membrane protein